MGTIVVYLDGIRYNLPEAALLLGLSHRRLVGWCRLVIRTGRAGFTHRGTWVRVDKIFG